MNMLASNLALAVLMWLAALVFTLPLRRRPRYWLRLVCMLPAYLAVLLVVPFHLGAVNILPWVLLAVLQVVTVALCTPQPLPGALYCAVWGIMTGTTVFEIWRLLPHNFMPFWVDALAAALLYLLLCLTLARWMPNDGSYKVGPRQLTSACLIGLLFVLQFEFLARTDDILHNPLLLPILLCQFYCLTLLYLQTELFKKSAMQKEMDTLNLLYERQREQYRTAKQNVQFINHKCHQLKMQVAALRKLAPDAATRANLQEVEDAVKIYDANVNTGNEVLDVVLTEKSLGCEQQGIQINCVADGTCLQFMEHGDLYALFASALDNATEAVAQLADPQKRMIDLLVCRRQGFTVINVINPLSGKLTFADGLPKTTKKGGGYTLKVIRRIVQKYGGILTVEANDGFFALKAVFPEQN